MKTLGRILIILLAASIVMGGTYVLLQTPVAQALVGQPIGGGEPESRSGPPEWANGTNSPSGAVGDHPGGDHEGRGGSSETLGRNLLQIAAIVAVAQVVWSIGRRLRKKSSPSPIAVNESVDGFDNKPG
jgi:hypothetical protein